MAREKRFGTQLSLSLSEGCLKKTRVMIQHLMEEGANDEEGCKLSVQTFCLKALAEKGLRNNPFRPSVVVTIYRAVGQFTCNRVSIEMP